MRRIAIFAFLCLVSTHSPARADDTADEAEFRFRHAAELYGKGKFDEALSEFFASNRLVRNNNVIFNIARCFEQLGQLNEAYRYFNDLAAEKWSAADRAALDAALERMRPKVALVRVETDPAGADVFVDRRDLGSRGVSPRTLALPPGPAKVLVDLAGFRSADRDVVLEKGKEVVVKLALERIYGFIDARADHGGTLIALEDAKDVAPCTAPCRLRVLPGRHALVASLDGHTTFRREVRVGLDETIAVEATLAPLPPPTGKLVVTANKDGALVIVDGKESGFTPVVVDALPVGPHDIRVSYEDFETWTAKAVITEGESTTLRARLSVPAPQVAAAAKTLTSSIDAPASVTVISGEEIRALGYRTLAQALRGVRGFSYNFDRIYEGLGVRGFSPPGDFNMRVQVLMDGHAWNDIWVQQGGVGWDVDVDLSQVERIEVVRGPNSALYGSSAVFAVVNVVHRTAPASGTVEVQAAGGTQGLARGRVTAGVERGTWGASVSVANARQQGDKAITFAPGGGWAGTTVKGLDAEEAQRVSLFAHAGGFQLVGALNNRDRFVPAATAFDAKGAQRDSWGRDTRGFLEGRYERAIGESTFNARVSFDQYDYDARWGYNALDECAADDAKCLALSHYEEVHKAQWLGSELRLRTGPFLGQNRLTAGLEAQWWLGVSQFVDDADNAPYLDKTIADRVLTAYLMDDLRLSDRLSLQFGSGARVDLTEEGLLGPNLSPRLAVVAHPYADGLTKLIVGRAFRVPNAYERYYEDGGYTQIPAKLPLAAETITSAEIEHTHRLNEETLVTAAAFFNLYEDQIRLAKVTHEGRPISQFANTNDPVQAAGAEGEVRWQPSRLSLVAFTYSYQYSFNTATPALPLENSPAHLASLRAMHPLSSTVILGGEALYGSARRTRDGQDTGESLVVNASLTGDVRRAGLQWGLHAYNLFNENYAYLGSPLYKPTTVPQYGRMLQVSLSASY